VGLPISDAAVAVNRKDRGQLRKLGVPWPSPTSPSSAGAVEIARSVAAIDLRSCASGAVHDTSGHDGPHGLDPGDLYTWSRDMLCGRPDCARPYGFPPVAALGRCLGQSAMLAPAVRPAALKASRFRLKPAAEMRHSCCVRPWKGHA